MTLLRAIDSLPPPPPRPPVTTLVGLAMAPPPPADTAPATPSTYAFTLIEALEMPGARGARSVPPPAPLPAAPVAAALPRPPERATPPVLAAAEVAAPLAELFRLLAAGPAAPDEAFAALRGEPLTRPGGPPRPCP